MRHNNKVSTSSHRCHHTGFYYVLLRSGRGGTGDSGLIITSDGDDISQIHNIHKGPCTLTSDFSYHRLGDVDFGPTMLCACADGEQHTILLTENYFL